LGKVTALSNNLPSASKTKEKATKNKILSLDFLEVSKNLQRGSGKQFN